MELDIRRILKKLTPGKSAPERKERKSGLAVSLKAGGHTIAHYTRDKEQVAMQEATTAGDDELRAMARGAKPIAACFSPRGIYADLGDFSSVSHEATSAHIRSTIDKTGLFNEPYAISFRKVYDLDKIRGRFSYLAIPLSETGDISVLDENEASLDSYCPVEASIAALTGAKTGEMCVALFEDEEYVRIVGAKAGIIYHLIAIGKLNAFDLLSETLAGVTEMSSLMKNTYNEAPKFIFTVGKGEISTQDLQDSGIDAVPFGIEGLPDDSLSRFELLGNAYCTGYDFMPQAFRDARTFSHLASYSLGISLAMAVVALFLFILGYGNFSEARDYENRIRSAQLQYVKDITLLEGNYASLLKQLDLTRINELISLYQDFEAEPKLYTMLGAITQAVPADLSIRRVEIARADLPKENGNPGSQEAQPLLPTSNPVFLIRVEGNISAQYPQSKVLFSTFLSGVQAHYPVLSATFSHNGDGANYKVECEAKK
jgi:hypothetical protein